METALAGEEEARPKETTTQDDPDGEMTDGQDIDKDEGEENQCGA